MYWRWVSFGQRSMHIEDGKCDVVKDQKQNYNSYIGGKMVSCNTSN